MELQIKDPVSECFDESLDDLNRAVAAAVAFFSTADEVLKDGEQSARQALAHIVFWHREYSQIVRAVATGRQPQLRRGNYRDLNVAAYEEFDVQPMAELAHQLSRYQLELDGALRALPDVTLTIPLKEGGRAWPADGMVLAIAAHINGHVRRLQRAGRVRPKDPNELRP
jgi:hypothetical protein